MKKHDFKRIACLFAAVLLLVPGALIALAAEEVSGSRVVVYDAPEGFDARDDYVVEVRAGGVAVLAVIVGRRVDRPRAVDGGVEMREGAPARPLHAPRRKCLP